MRVLAILVLTIMLLGALAFAGFGFLATFEPGPASFLAWRIGYGVMILGSVIGLGALTRASVRLLRSR